MRSYLDVNCFMGTPESPYIRSFESADELLAEMDDIGIEKAFVSHFDAQKEYIYGNFRLMEMIGSRKRLLPCWIVNPGHLMDKHNSGGLKSLIPEMKDAGVRMVRVQPGPVNGYSLYHWAMGDLAGALIENKIILFVDLLVQYGPGHLKVPEYEWDILYGFAAKYPELKLIVSSMKLSVSKIQVMGLLRSCPNVLLDISSFQSWRSTEMICSDPGPGQLVFGSRMPFFDAAQFIVQVEKAAVPEDAKSRISSKNISQLAGL